MKMTIERIRLQHKRYTLERPEETLVLNEQQRKSLAVICYHIHNNKN